MSNTLYDRLLKYTGEGYVPFHMPGHKRNAAKFGLCDCAQIDITEIDGFDDYHYPQGILKEIQERAAQVYNTEASFYLVNGSTCGLLTAISAACDMKDAIVVARNCHKAVYNAIYLRGLMPEYVYPVVDKQTGILCGIDPKDVEDALYRTGAKAVVITSPTYEGVVSDIGRISGICHRHNAVLIVDEAHGAHFNYSEEFPETAMSQGADIVIESLHKTLPCYTQTAILHVMSDRADMGRIRKFLSIYQTSSPSYVFMSGIDSCIEYMTCRAGIEDNVKYISRLKKLRKACARLKNIKLFHPTNFENKVYDYDISKLVLFSKGRGVFMYDYLLNVYRIQPEMAAADYVILMTSVGDKRVWYRYLLVALRQLDMCIETEADPGESEEGYDILGENECAVVDMSPKDADEREDEYVLCSLSEGRIAKEAIYAYPPGIPIVYPGERITAEILNRIDKLSALGVNIKGFSDGKGERLRCIK